MQQEQHTYQALWNIVHRLRSPGGCPWDREQTHQSLRRNLLEECYEALETLDAEDWDGLAEELGDVMVQIVFHCQIAAEKGTFTQAEMFRHICEKLVRRHPHVFGDVTVRDAREVESNWEETKRQERGGDASALDGVAKGMPALGYGQAISYRAAKAGFEWEGLPEVMAKVREELEELEEAEGEQRREEELGDALLALVNAARWMGVDAETALRQANARFYRRFTHMESAVRAQGRGLRDASRDEKLALWDKAKRARG